MSVPAVTCVGLSGHLTDAGIGRQSGEVALKHSGAVPAGEYTEAGGLLLLRYEAESVGGRMTALTGPSFTVVITLPAE